jgi:hypothetical protein
LCKVEHNEPFVIKHAIEAMDDFVISTTFALNFAEVEQNWKDFWDFLKVCLSWGANPGYLLFFVSFLALFR